MQHIEGFSYLLPLLIGIDLVFLGDLEKCTTKLSYNFILDRTLQNVAV